MKYLLLFIIICALYSGGLALVIRHYEGVRLENRNLLAKNEELAGKVAAANREVNGIWKEKQFWIRESMRKK